MKEDYALLTSKPTIVKKCTSFGLRCSQVKANDPESILVIRTDRKIKDVGLQRPRISTFFNVISSKQLRCHLLSSYVQSAKPQTNLWAVQMV